MKVEFIILKNSFALIALASSAQFLKNHAN